MGSGYTVPSSNPFVGPGAPLDEIWGKGFRNPYRIDIDPMTGDIYVADVGAGCCEEVSVEAASEPGGGNYGWNLQEGFTCKLDPPTCDTDLRLPVHDYSHDEGRCAIIGGSVYRGIEMPALRGRYFFADYCTSQIFSLTWDGVGGVADVTEHTTELIPDVGVINSISAIGRDGFGELYIVDRSGGELFKLVSTPASSDDDGDGVANGDDNCPTRPNGDQADDDEDGWGDACDNCIHVPNADQADVNVDGFGNVCDADYDDNGLTNLLDFVAFRRALFHGRGEPGYLPAADHDFDGVIGIPDFNLFRRRFADPPGPSGYRCASSVPCSVP
jgi:hypothetical protein